MSLPLFLSHSLMRSSTRHSTSSTVSWCLLQRFGILQRQSVNRLQSAFQLQALGMWCFTKGHGALFGLLKGKASIPLDEIRSPNCEALSTPPHRLLVASETVQRHDTAGESAEIFTRRHCHNFTLPSSIGCKYYCFIVADKGPPPPVAGRRS